MFLAPYNVFRVCVFAFLSGILLLSIVPVPASAYFFYSGCLVAGGAVIVGWRSITLRIVSLTLLAFLVGLFRFEIAAESLSNTYATVGNFEKGAFVGTIISEPRVQDRQTFIVESSSGTYVRFFVSTDLFPRYHTGEIISVRCKRIATDEKRGGWAMLNRITARCVNPIITSPPDTSIQNIQEVTASLKGYMNESVARWMPSPHNSLLMGILVGAREAFPRSLATSFSAVGLSHIVAISGYNISILIAALAPLVRRIRLNRWLQIGIISIGIAVFTFFTGASAATVRAAIMGIAALVGTTAGRPVMSIQLLLAAVILMVAHDPFILAFDRGFQLSCTATLGIITISPFLMRLFGSSPTVFDLRQVIIQTCAASAGTLPLLLGYFSQFSLISFLTNILVVPLIPFIMALGSLWILIASIANLFSGNLFRLLDPFIGFLALPVWSLLEYMITVAEWFSRFPFPKLTLANPFLGWTIVGILYAFFGTGLYRFRKAKEKLPHDFSVW